LIPVDAALSRAASRARAGLEVSRALVEVAMVFFERPARPRILAIELNWRASRAGDVLGSLVNAPWVEVLTADEALDVRASDRRLTLPRPPRPTRGFLRSLDGAREAVGRFTAFTLPGNPVTSSLHSSLEAALGTSWWSDDWDEGVRWTRQISGVVERERTQITAQGAGVTFTSRRGEIPITVVNRTGYPVRVRVDVTSPKLEFPEGSSRVIDVLPPPGATITFPANAEATGTFPLRITLSSPDGAVVVSSEELLVRSTAANVLALALTGGALLFLLVWYGRRLLPSGRPTDA
jgi:hypothetical protein